jgi:hypothetical protein
LCSRQQPLFFKQLKMASVKITGVGVKAEELTITQKFLGYSMRTSFMTAPDGFWVSTSTFPFTANSYWLLAPMTNALFATMAFVVSMLALTVCPY